MEIGKFKIGNSYNSHKIDQAKIKLNEGEKLSDLNKIELRYGARKDDPAYPGFKALHKWRSVFGYKLGGQLRMLAVKIQSLSIPKMNTQNFQALKDKGMAQDYDHLFTTKDVLKALNINNPGKSVGNLKYLVGEQMPVVIRDIAAGYDHSKVFAERSQAKAEDQYLDIARTLREDCGYSEEKIKQTIGELRTHNNAHQDFVEEKAKMKNEKTYLKNERMKEFKDSLKDLHPIRAFSVLFRQVGRDAEHIRDKYPRQFY